MKVLQVLPTLQSGGVERGTLEIAAALVAAGEESWVMSGGGKMVAELEAAGTTHYPWALGKKSPLTLLQVPKLRRWLQQQAFDVVHLRSRMPAWVVWLAWRGMDKSTRPRLVSTVHGMHSVSRYSQIVTCGEKIIAVSRSIEAYIRDNYPRGRPGSLAAGRVQLIFRGIDPQAFPPNYQADEAWLRDWYAQYPQLRETAVITLPGRLTRLKGHLDFIDILKALLDAGVKVKGLVVGDEDPKRQSYAREVYQKVAELGLQDDLIFAGFRADIKEIYAVSDLVLSLSTKPESFGRSVLEPLAMGVPVVGYDHGGVGEILETLFPEGAVPLRDIDAVATAARRQLSGQGQAVRPNTQFLLSDMTACTLDLYRTLVASPRDLL